MTTKNESDLNSEPTVGDVCRVTQRITQAIAELPPGADERGQRSGRRNDRGRHRSDHSTACRYARQGCGIHRSAGAGGKWFKTAAVREKLKIPNSAPKAG
jgi:hypothetical protein